jgi:chemotaxis protein MotB
MNSIINKASITIIAILFLASCVPTREYQQLQKKCTEEGNALKKENQSLSSANIKLKSDLKQLNKAYSHLQKDSAEIMTALNALSEEHKKLMKNYDGIKAQNERLIQGSDEESKKVLTELQQLQEDLVKREDRLFRLERELDEKNRNLKELQDILNRKDSVVKALKNTVSDALFGFEDQGLSVYLKNGKVYVSLEESLLFSSGSYNVGSRGREALVKLKTVLEEKADINVLIEGHTDNVPYMGSGQIKDNWDLSVMRATAIVKILTSNSSIDPKRLTAAGRGEYHPVAPNDSPENKQKNRRTDIILSPKLDELFQVLETN